MKPRYLDRQETRPPHSREAALLRDLRAIVSIAKARAPALRRQVKGIDIASLKTRADLARIPVVREADLRTLQTQEPPFGGLVATRVSALKRVIVSPGPVFEPEGYAKDWWGAARALCAAGVGKGDVILNCFSHHLGHDGFVVDSGANALDCAVIAAGRTDLELLFDMIRILKPSVYCGRLDFLAKLVETAHRGAADIGSMTCAVVTGSPLSPHVRRDFEKQGVSVRQIYCVPHVGVVAYESEGPDGTVNEGMIVNEGLLIEIVAPGTDHPLRAGEIGEVVVTRLNPDYPLLRFGTGQLSALLPAGSPCGRTNLRIKGYLGPVDPMANAGGASAAAATLSAAAPRRL